MPDDPLLLFSVLYGFWVQNAAAVNGDAMRELAAQFLSLAEKQDAKAPLMIGHRMIGFSLMCTGDVAASRGYYDRALALYDPAVHRPLAMRFGQDTRAAVLTSRSQALWLLGYPDAALIDAENALNEARKIGQAATLMHTLLSTAVTLIYCSKYTSAKNQLEELINLADEKGSVLWKVSGVLGQAFLLTLTGKAAEAINIYSPAIAAFRSTGTTLRRPSNLSHLATAYAKTGEFDAAWRTIDEAIKMMATTKETWFEAEVLRVAGEIARMSLGPERVKPETYLERALAIARAQQAKSLELRAAMSLARLYRDQSKRDAARNLLAPVYNWFTEGFGTLDLKEAKALLDELASRAGAPSGDF